MLYQLLYCTAITTMLNISQQEIIEIKLLAIEDVSTIKHVITTVTKEIFKLEPSIDELIKNFARDNIFADEDTLVQTYFNNNGTYLILVAGETIVGTGAIKKFSNDICELKRMFILKEYRGQGWGKKVANQLLLWAKDHSYKKIRLEIWKPKLQHQAIIFYKKLGFTEIPPYRDHYDPGIYSMEKNLI